MSKAAKSHPTYAKMATAAVIAQSHFGKGATRQAISKQIGTAHSIEVSVVALRTALKKLVADGVLTQDGQRFKITPSGRAATKKKAPKKAKTTKKKTTKKAKTSKKKTAKKSTKKSTKKSGTKKTKKAKKSTKKSGKKGGRKAAAPATAQA